MKKIIYQSGTYAKKYFMKQSSYFNLELPAYFDFTKVLNYADKKLKVGDLNTYYNSNRNLLPGNLEKVNYKFLCNKDGKYAWRPFQIIHPLLYVNLVNEITETTNWKIITDRFKEFKKNKNIICCSDIVASTNNRKNKATTILNWWEEFEQKSLALSMEYLNIAVTDITDCYGSIYTHTIPWAIYGKAVAKSKKNDKTLIGNKIDGYIQNMSYQQTNGIPQGSNLMDFIVEIILGYADLELTKKLATSKIKDYTILRYRDDYRIFTNNTEIANKILKLLTEVLSELNMKLNSNKTVLSDDVIENSIKKDKVYWKSRKKLMLGMSLQYKLLEIRELGKKFPNCGSLKTALTELYKEDVLTLVKKPKNIEVLLSITADIMYNNPRTFDICSAIFVKLFENSAESSVLSKIRLILKRFGKIPNTDYLDVWLQRGTIKFKNPINTNSMLCKRVFDSTIKIWDSSWLNFVFDESTIVDSDKIPQLNKFIQIEEIDLFDY